MIAHQITSPLVLVRVTKPQFTAIQAAAGQLLLASATKPTLTLGCSLPPTTPLWGLAATEFNSGPMMAKQHRWSDYELTNPPRYRPHSHFWVRWGVRFYLTL